MKRWPMLCLVLCLAALSACAMGEAAGEAAWVGDSAYQYYYHATARCRLAENVAPVTRADAEAQGRQPCPVCWPDESAHEGIECIERGGTLVVRIPDAEIAARLAEASAPAAVPEELLFTESNRLDDLARLVHGESYRRWADAATPGTAQALEAFIPDLDAENTDALLMSRRHLGAAWYIVVRPSEGDREALKRDGRVDLPVAFYRADLRVASYDAGITLHQGDGSTRWAGTLTLSPQKSGGEVAYREEDGIGGCPVYVVKDGDVNTAVFRWNYIDDYSTAASFSYLGQKTRLQGYVDGRDIVYICALTDGELAAMREKLGYDLFPQMADADDGEAADMAALADDYAPATFATLAGGTEAAMDRAEYPVGTGFVSYTLTRPAGGVAFYGCEVFVDRLADGHWQSAGGVVRAYADDDPERACAGYFCDHVTLTVPLEGIGALEEGLYRLEVSGDSPEETDVVSCLEFRVTADAPAPVLPEKRTFGGEGLAVAPHTVPHLDSENYNSCMDTTRVYEGGGRTRLLAGDTVFDLRGVDESWGWGIHSHYYLFAYPEGHPEQARQLLANFNHSDVTLYDLGDGLLLFEGSGGRLYRCDYDGGNLVELGSPTDGGGVSDLLPVGGGVYAVGSNAVKNNAVWYTSLADFEPRVVYRADDEIRNSSYGMGHMVYADGRLIVADKGIVALDARCPNADGTLPVNWLTIEYDPESGTSGFGYLALGGRLYYWSESKKAMLSMTLDGTDIQTVSKERCWFHSATPGGVVLALSGSEEGFWGDERTAAAFYFPSDPDHPAFDPDRCRKREIEPECFDFVLGETFYHRDADGVETAVEMD